MNKEALHKLAAESLNEGLRLDEWDKIGCVNHDCDQCKAQQEPVQQEPVAIHQFRKRGCSDWHDGLPDHHDGQGPYEVRTLYTTPQAQPAQSTADKSELETVPAKGGLLPAQQEPVAEVKAKMTGGNVGIATVIHEIHSPIREPLQPGDKLYAAYRWVGWDVEQVWSERIFGIDMRFENVQDAIAFRKKLEEATTPQAQPAREPEQQAAAIMTCGAVVSNVYEAYEAGKQAQPAQRKPLTDDKYEAIVEDIADWNRYVEVDTAHQSLEKHVREVLTAHGITKGNT